MDERSHEKFKEWLVEGKDYILLDGEQMEFLLREEREGRVFRVAREGRHQDDAVEPDGDDTQTKEQIMEWFKQRMDSVPEGARMDVKIALS